MRKEKDSYTTKGKDIPTLREGGFTYSADQKMTDCHESSASQKASSKAQNSAKSKAQNSSMSNKAQNKMSSKAQNSMFSKYGDPSTSGKTSGMSNMCSQTADSTKSKKSESKKSGSVTDCR